MKLSIHYNTPVRPIGLMNAVNNGPVYVPPEYLCQTNGNLDLYKAAKVFPCDGKFVLTMEPNTVIVLK